MEKNVSIPKSWYIWLVLWVIPIILSVVNYSNDPAGAISILISTGILIVLMIAKPKWVLPWFGLILIFDLIGYGMMLTENGVDIGFLLGSLLKELFFLGYLLFSNNAKKYQGRI